MVRPFDGATDRSFPWPIGHWLEARYATSRAGLSEEMVDRPVLIRDTGTGWGSVEGFTVARVGRWKLRRGR